MVERIVKNALKKGSAILGFKESIKFLKINKAKLVIIAENMPEEMKKDIDHLCKLSKTKIRVFEGTSRELGVVCGKPYPISTIVIKG